MKIPLQHEGVARSDGAAAFAIYFIAVYSIKTKAAAVFLLKI